MGITSSSYTLLPKSIACNGEVEAIFSLAATPNILTNPTDIVLVLDCSASMLGEPFAAMKAGVNTFLDILDEATDDSQNGQIGSGSRVGIVRFAQNASEASSLQTSVADLKQTVADLTISGGTNHEAAFTLASQILECCGNNQKVIVMFTDGKSSAGGSAIPITTAAKAAGVLIYCIVLEGIYGTDIPTASLWVSSPASAFLSVAPDAAALEALFANLAANITKPGATQLQLEGSLIADFQLTEVYPPSKGTAQLLDAHTFRWTMDALGSTSTEGATLRVRMRHIGQKGGDKEPIQQLSYSDAEGNVAIFAPSSIEVDCPEEIVIDPCPSVHLFEADACEDFIQYDLGEIDLHHTGRILECNLMLRNICPNQRTALTLILKEIDRSGKTIQRGFLTFTVPAHHAKGCRNVRVKSIRFVLPDDCMPACSLCEKRRFSLQVLANGVDTDFHCETL